MTPYRSGPGTRTAEVGQEATLTTTLRAVLRDVDAAALLDVPLWLSDYGLPTVRLSHWEPRRITLSCPSTELARLHRLHYRRPHRGPPAEISVYLPEGVVTLRAEEGT